MRKKLQKGIQKEPSVPTVSKNKSTLRQANSVLPLQTGPRASPPSCLRSTGEGAARSQPDLRQMVTFIHAGRAAEAQHASGPQSSPRSFQGASFVMRLAHRPQ